MRKHFIICSLAFFCSHSQAANITQVSRYATVNNQPLAAQINPLKTVQQIHFPTSVQTIEDAVQYWVRYSGYHLASKEKQIESLKQVFQQPLPQINRNLGPLTIAEGLTVLIGQNLFILRQDDLLREINFILITRKAA